MTRARAFAPILAFFVLTVVVAVIPAFVSAFRAQQFAYVAIYLIAIIGLNLIGTYVDFVGADLRLPVALLVILVVLLVKPTGIFGKAEVRRV